jgi:WD40 repeat protein
MFSCSVATNGIETAFKPTYTTCLLPSVSLDLKDARFPWKTKHAAKQYASNVRFLGSESMLVLSIENESLIYDTENCILTSLFQGHSDKINSLVFSPLLDIFVTASSDRFVKAWDISRAPKFDLLEHSSLSRITTIVIGRCNCDVFSDSMECTFFFGCSDGSLGVNKCHKTGILEPLISTDYSLSTAFLKHNYSVSSISFFRSAKSSFPDVVASGDENGGIILWNASDRKHLKTFATTRSSPIVACHFFLPAVAEGEEMHVNLFTITGDAFCVVWDAELGTAIRFINLPVPTVSHVQISKECSFCVLRHPGNSAFTLLDYISLANLGLLKPQLFVSENETMTSLTLSIGGERCAVGSSSGDICLLEPHSRHMISVGKHHQKDVTILLWTRFMNRLVSSSGDMTLAIWDGSNSPCGEESEYSHGGFPVFEPIIFHKLDAKLTVIRECENLPCKTAASIQITQTL